MKSKDPERDVTHKGIMQRYEKANRLAIASHNAVLFDSIRDIFWLLKVVDELEEKIKLLEEKLKEKEDG